MRVPPTIGLAALLLLTPVLCVATPVATPPATEVLLDTATVRGTVPGPGMWKVNRGPNTLWILGVQSPVPAKMEWNPGKVKAVIAKAEEVIGAPGVHIDADVGFFGRLALIPSLLKVRANPDGKQLKDVVPEAAYARWVPLKRAYIGNDRSVERYRPMFAASELYERAIGKSGLANATMVGDEIRAAMEKRGLKSTSTRARVKVENIRGAIRDFKAAQLADLDCFQKTLDRLETDLHYMRQRANAWAVGDIERLRALQRPDQFEACKDAIMKSAVASKFGLDSAEAQSRQKWIAASSAALERNAVTFATLSMRDLLDPDGPVAALAAKGYVVEPPTKPIDAEP